MLPARERERKKEMNTPPLLGTWSHHKPFSILFFQILVTCICVPRIFFKWLGRTLTFFGHGIGLSLCST